MAENQIIEENKELIVTIIAINDNYEIKINDLNEINLKFQDNQSKLLFPLLGIPLLDIWLNKLLLESNFDINNLYIITIQKYYSKFIEWGQGRSIPYNNILLIPLEHFSQEKKNLEKNEINYEFQEISSLLYSIDHFQVLKNQNILVLSGNCLIDDEFEFSHFFDNNLPFEKVLIYQNNNNINNNNQESNNTSTLIPIYTLSTSSLKILSSTEPLDTHLELINYLLKEHNVHFQNIFTSKYYPLNSIIDYHHAIQYLESIYQNKYSHLPNHVNMICPARAGLMGNPSDGFGGKTLSFVVNNFYAQVNIIANPTLAVELIPHPIFDMTHFESFDLLHKETQLNGYYGGLRLLKATCRSFAKRCCQLGLTIHFQRGFKMSYDTNIPRRVGLSGSSAIIVAAYKGLMEFFGLTLLDLQLELSEFPQIILNIEQEELHITAGLQDRVIQTYGGIVHMDFTNLSFSTETTIKKKSHLPNYKHGTYTIIDKSLLPKLYLAYNIDEGSDSGKVHSTVKMRYLNGDIDVINGMKEIGNLADEAKECLFTNNMIRLGELMNRNFELRRQLYGDEAVGKKNIKIHKLANDLGFAAKFTGSGGAFLCLLKSGDGWILNEEIEELVREQFNKEGFEFIRIESLV